MTLTTVVFSVWAVFWICWLLAATGAKQSVRTSRFRRPGLVVLVAVVLVRLFKPGTLAVSSPVLHVVGLILFALGLALGWPGMGADLPGAQLGNADDREGRA